MGRLVPTIATVFAAFSASIREPRTKRIAYKLSQIGLRQWQKFAREMRVEVDELVELLVSMAKQFPDEVNAARAREEGLDDTIIERLATQLVKRANECRRWLGSA